MSSARVPVRPIRPATQMPSKCWNGGASANECRGPYWSICAGGETATSLGLTGSESFTITGLDKLQPRQEVEVEARLEEGDAKRFRAVVRIDSPVEVTYFENGGILNAVLRDMLSE